MRAALASLTALAALSANVAARAGGYELPDVGAEALGRGATFTAKADNGTAFTYNPAGFAQQRHTRVMADASLVFDTYTFTRAGTYPDNPQDTRTPWGGRTFPAVSNASSPTLAPYLTLSSDLGVDRWTFAVGVFGPSGTSGRLFPAGVENAPSPARYDVIQSDSIVAYPSVAAAYRITEDLDLGLAVHGVYGSFDVLTVTANDFGPSTCPNREFRGCDSDSRFRATGFTAAATLGALWRVTRNVTLGLSLRSPWSMTANGTVTSTPPPSMPQPIPDAKGTLEAAFPLVTRAGARYAHLEGEVEVADVELDVTHEAWSAVEGTGPRVSIPNIEVAGAPQRIDSITLHGYGDTMSVRLGGAYNVVASEGAKLALRAGAFHDTAATAAAFTRVDANTLAKTGITAGVGLRMGALSLDLAYAEVFCATRDVVVGAIRPMNGLKNGASVDGENRPLDPVNAGRHSAHVRMISFGLGYTFGATK